jgi:ribA/ribD-fused uncharacterized protein
MAILGFTGRYHFLSNFHASPIEMDGLKYPTVEHAFQAAKTKDATKARRIREAESAKEAKRLGGRNGIVKPLRPDWEQIKDDVMYKCLQCKFTQNPSLKKALLNTGDEYLEETNTWRDIYWGVCNGAGQNKLGKLLMKLRDELRKK